MCYAGCKYENREGECMLDYEDDYPPDAVCMADDGQHKESLVDKELE